MSTDSRYMQRSGKVYNIPEKIISTVQSNTIYAAIATGSYVDIMKEIMNQKTFLQFFNEEHRTGLHYLLANTSLNNNEKYNLAKLLIAKHAPVDVPDTNGIRPLHLASTQQNSDLVILLLQNGAEPNSTDITYMTPLHYAVLPSPETCKSRKKTELFAENKVDIRTNDLFEKIFNEFRYDSVVQMYFIHMKNLFALKILNDNDVNAINKIIANILNQPKTVPLKESFEKELIQLRDKIYNMKISEISQSLANAEIHENTPNGWAPKFMHKSMDPNNAILPYANLLDKFNTDYTYITQFTKNSVDELMQSYEKLGERIDIMELYIMSLNDDFNMLFDYRNLIDTFKKFLTDDMNLQQYSVIINNFANDLQHNGAHVPNDSFFNDPRLNVYVAQTSYFYQNENQLSNFLTKNFTSIGDIIAYYSCSLLRLYKYMADKCSPFKLEITITNLIADIQFNIGKSLEMTKQNEIIEHICDLQIMLVNCNYILILMSHYLEKLENRIAKLKADMNNDIKKEMLKLIVLLENIIDNVIKRKHNATLSTGNTRVFVKKVEKKRYSFHLDGNILSINRIVVTKTRPHPPENIKYMRRVYILKEKYRININRLKNLKELLKNFDNNFNDIINFGTRNIKMIYDNVTDIQKSLNKTIDSFNLINGMIYIKNFNNDFEFNNFANPQMKQMKYITLSPMNHIKIPDSYDEIHREIMQKLKSTDDKMTANDVLLTIQYLINKYGYRISDVDELFTVIHTERERDFNKGIVSYQLDQTINGMTISKFYQIPVGTYVISKQIDPNKITAHKILNSVLDFHINYIRYVLIMYFVDNIMSNYNTTVSENDDYYLLYKEISKLIDDLKEISGVNQTRFLLVIIAKMVDEIIIASIDNIINISASLYIKNILEQNKTDVPSLLNIKESDFRHATSLIIMPKRRTKLHGSDIIQDIIREGTSGGQFKNHSENLEILQFFGELYERDDDNDQYRLINFDSKNVNDDICYTINSDVIKALLDGGAKPNVSERSGETPLSLAVQLQNGDIVDMLLRAGSRIYDENRNIYALCYHNLLDTIETSPMMNIEQINQKVKVHLEKMEIVQIFKNSDIILKMAMYILDHQITSYASTYPNMWTYDEHNQLLNILNLRNLDRDIIPLAKIDDKFIGVNIEGHITYDESIDIIRQKLAREADLLTRFTNSIKELTAELSVLKSTDIQRKKEIENAIAELQMEKIDILSNVTKYVNSIEELIVNKDDATRKMSDVSKITKAFEQPSNNINNRQISKVYDEYFKLFDVNSAGNKKGKEYATYTKMWKKLLARPNREVISDYTQLVNSVQRFIDNMGMVQPNVFINSYHPIISFYDKVLNKYGRDYLELPMYYSPEGKNDYTHNYVLRQIVGIMIHVFKHTISINYINFVAHLLARKDKSKDLDKIMINVYQSLNTSGFMRYCLEIMPRQVVKIVCKISEGENDPETKLTTQEVLNTSLDRLKLSTYDVVSNDFLHETKEKLVSPFIIYMESYVSEMYLLIVKQIKSLMVQSRWLNILKLLSDKAVLETKYLS